MTITEEHCIMNIQLQERRYGNGSKFNELHH